LSRNRPIRILQFVNTLEFGGATDYALTLCEQLNKSEFVSYLAHGPGSGWEDRAESCCEDVLFLDTMKPSHTKESNNTYVGDLLALFKLYRYLKLNQIDVVHTHGSKSRLLGGIAATLARVPMKIQSAHGFSFNSRQPRWKKSALIWVERLMGALHHRLILESQHDLRVATELKFGRSWQCIYTGISFKELDINHDTETLRSEIVINPNSVVITMIGRLTEQKDPHTFVKAAKIVRQTNPEAIFLIVGDGDLYESTAALIDDRDGIRLLGRRTNVNALIAASDVFMICSRWDGVPLTLLAAMYLGKPVVATNKLGLPEVVVEGKNGFLASEGEPAEYATAVLRLVKDKELRVCMGRFATECVREKYSLESMVKNFETIYIGSNLN